MTGVSIEALFSAEKLLMVLSDAGGDMSGRLVTVHETPTKRKGGSENLCMTNGPDAAALSLADQANNNGRIRLVSLSYKGSHFLLCASLAFHAPSEAGLTIRSRAGS
jgi:hypothetical protein